MLIKLTYLIHNFTVGSIHFSLLGQYYWNKIFLSAAYPKFFSLFQLNWDIYKLQRSSYKGCQNYALSFTSTRLLTMAKFVLLLLFQRVLDFSTCSRYYPYLVQFDCLNHHLMLFLKQYQLKKRKTSNILR